MKFIVGKKIEMSQIFKDSGEVVPVTMIKAMPCVVTQVKTVSKDGYSSIQLGTSEAKRLNKSEAGHVKDFAKFSILKEYRVAPQEAENFKRGTVVTAEIFTVGEKVTVEGISKGKGFAGVVKRHGFHGQNSSHGNKDQSRMPGSAGPGGVQRVFKGSKKPGRMGTDQITVTNLEIVKFDPSTNILYVKGAVPGARHSIVSIYNASEITIPLTDFNTKPAVEAPVVVEAVAVPEVIPEVIPEIIPEVAPLEVKSDETVSV